MENKLKIGWAEVDITPHQKIRVAGQFYERVSDVVETPISVTALALESAADGTQGVICSCDLDCISEGLVELVRAELRDVEGLDKSKIIIGATHTHTSYQYDEASGLSRVQGTDPCVDF